MVKKILYSVAIVITITTLAVAVIAYGRGYRLSPSEKSLKPTGILSVTSTPEAASIFIDGKLTSATNNAITLAPGWYNLAITKVGYQGWENRLRIQGEVVTRVDALLIPTNPSLRVLTVSGVMHPSFSPTGTRVAYIVPQEEATRAAVTKPRTGLWTFELRSGPLGGIAEPKQILATSAITDWKNAYLVWSPDEKELVLVVKTATDKMETVSLALQILLDNPQSVPLDVTTTLDSILADWKTVSDAKQEQTLTSVPPPISDFLKKGASKIQFSPDNNKILYLATSAATLSPLITPPIAANSTPETRSVEKGKYYVYDLKEDKNFALVDAQSIAASPLWYPDAKRIVMIENVSIVIIDYDGTNKRTVYAGPFSGNVVYPWTSAGKLVILTNLNKPQTIPNLYEVDIR